MTEQPPQTTALETIMLPHLWHFTREFYHDVGQQGEVLHFGGNGGDSVLNAGSAYLPDLLRSKHPQISRFIREGRLWARLHNVSALKFLGMEALIALQGPTGALRRTAHQVETKTDYAEDPASMIDIWALNPTVLAWLTPEIRTTLGARLRKRADELRVDGSLGDYITRERLLQYSYDYVAEARYAAAENPGISFQSPFFDNNVARAVFSAPVDTRSSPETFKLVLQFALRGIMPDFILNRQTKGSYNSLLAQLHIDSLDQLSSLLGDSRLAALRIIDPEKVQQALNNPASLSMSAMWGLSMIQMTELWLRDLEKQGYSLSMPSSAVAFPPSAPTPAEATVAPHIDDSTFYYSPPIYPRGGITRRRVSNFK